jgi:hypothetical protein
MANRAFHQPQGHLEINVVSLFGAFTLGASGAVASSTGKGIASVTKETEAGRYTIALSDTYNGLLFADAKLLHATLSDPTTVGIFANLLSQQVGHATAPGLVFQFVATDDGAAANPASGAVVYFRIDLRNSSVS